MRKLVSHKNPGNEKAPHTIFPPRRFPQQVAFQKMPPLQELINRETAIP